MSSLDKALIKAFSANSSPTVEEHCPQPDVEDRVENGDLELSSHATVSLPMDVGLLLQSQHEPEQSHLEPEQSQHEPEPSQHELDLKLESDSPPRELNPTWEMDRFKWPAHCETLLARCGDPLGDAMSQLRQRGQVILVTSSHRQEGRTTFALTMAKWASQQGLRVALVDADLANLQLADQLGAKGIDFHDAASPNDLAIVSLEEGITLLATLPVSDDRDAQASADMSKSVLQQLTTNADIVIVDGGPTSALEESSSTAACACDPDVVVFLRHRDLTSDRQLADSAGRLTTRGIDDVFLVETFCQTADRNESLEPKTGAPHSAPAKRAA